MSSRRFASRTRSVADKRTPSRSGRGPTGVLIFFLILFLLLLLFLVQARLSQTQAIALDLVLLLLCGGIVGSWLVKRQERTLMMSVRKGEKTRPARAADLFTAGAVTIADLLRLTPGEFEDFVGDLLTATGQYHEVRRIGGAGDRGADLLAKDRFNRPFIVQCKRYQLTRKINAGEMRNFLGAKGIYGADECLFVTTSTFTEAARANMAHLQHSVFLWDGGTLVQLIEEYWPHLSTRWQRLLLEQGLHTD